MTFSEIVTNDDGFLLSDMETVMDQQDGDDPQNGSPRMTDIGGSSRKPPRIDQLPPIFASLYAI